MDGGVDYLQSDMLETIVDPREDMDIKGTHTQEFSKPEGMSTKLVYFTPHCQNHRNT